MIGVWMMQFQIVVGLSCSEPPTSEKSDIQKIQDEAAIKTKTPLGTFSMAVSNVKAGEEVVTPSAQVELGIVNIAELGSFVPKRIEITPFVYNQVEGSPDEKLDLEKDQGVGIKLRWGNPDKEIALTAKATVSADSLNDPSPSKNSEIQGVASIMFERNFGTDDPERMERLKRLRNAPRPLIIYVTNEDFDRKTPRSPAEVEIIHRSLMTTYLEAAIETWLQKHPNEKDPAKFLDSRMTNATVLHAWLREMMVTYKPFYIEAQDGRQIYVRPHALNEPISRTPLLFDPSQMLSDFVMNLDYPGIR